MRLVKWLFHPMIVFVIVVLIAVYINRDVFFPELSESPEVKQITSRVDSVIEKMNETVSSLAQKQQRPSEPQPQQIGEEQHVTSEEEPEQKAAPEEEPKQMTVPEVLPERKAAPEVAEDAEHDTPQAEPEQRATQTVAPQEETDSETSSEAIPTATGSDEPATTDSSLEEPQGVPSAPAAAMTPQQSDPLTLWDDARRAAWKGNSTVAIDKYHTLIGMQPSNFDAYGELGNVLLHHGDTASAVDAYYQAALLLSESHYFQAAWRVLGIVSRLDPNKGQRLYATLRQQQLWGTQPRHQ